MAPSEPGEVSEVPRLPPRPADAHKGTFGRLAVVAGSRGMSGAAVLCASAGLRGGAGLVTAGVPASVQPVVAAGNPCVMTRALPDTAAGQLALAALPEVLQLLGAADAGVVGPGLGRSAALATVLRGVLAGATCPLVLDADALNLLADDLGWLKARKAPTVLTPHPGEFARLARCSTAEVQVARRDRAVNFARDHGAVVVLKGHATVVAGGGRVYVNTTGNPGMATAGAGDVLAGLIGALLAGGQEAFTAATGWRATWRATPWAKRG
jgi:NAD(P)H-hydrate epimerase